MLAIAVVASCAARSGARHVVLIALDGWGAYSVPKAENIPNIRDIMKKRMLYVAFAERAAFVIGHKLGLDVHGSRYGAARLYGMELAHARDTFVPG